MTEKTHTHRWTDPTPRVRPDGEHIERGDEFSPTTHELRCWPTRIEALATEPFDPSGLTVEELRDELAANDYSDADLRDLRDAEAAGEHRVGALDALVDALDNEE